MFADSVGKAAGDEGGGVDGDAQGDFSLFIGVDGGGEHVVVLDDDVVAVGKKNFPVGEEVLRDVTINHVRPSAAVPLDHRARRGHYKESVLVSCASTGGCALSSSTLQQESGQSEPECGV